MQRGSSSSLDSDDDHHNHHHIVDMPPMTQSNPRRRMERFTGPPIKEPRSGTGIGKRDSSRSPLLANLIHSIPVIIFICFFVLWWFSFPVNLEVKDMRFPGMTIIRKPLPINDAEVDLDDPHVELTILASATSPNASAPQVLTLTNEPELQPVSQYSI